MSSLEAYWAALTSTQAAAPSFLQLFHQQVTTLGLYNAELAASTDLISDLIWPVMGRLMRFRLTEMLSVEKVREWAVGSTLLFFAANRQMGLTLEQIRENDLSVSVALQTPSRQTGMKNSLSRALAGFLGLGVFLLSLWMAFRFSGSEWETTATLVAGALGLTLFFLLNRMR